MSRSVPWRNKPTALISQMIPVAKQLKLYLVNEIGPTSLVLKDENDNKFKVIIGDTVNCSCNVVKNDHCIHSLFVMLKKFKVSQNHPILWQASYLDSELDGMTQHKYQQTQKQKVRTTAKQFLKKKKQTKKQDEEDFPPLDQEQVCPICYEQMNRQCYSSCETCHKSFHTKCLKVWTKHKESSMAPVTCPMCRTKFVDPYKLIARDQQRWQQIFSTHKGTFCKGCGQKNIKGFIYKCLICPNNDLCKLCYEGNQHLQHQLFCVKQLSIENYKLAPMRARKTKKQLFQPTQQMNIQELPSLGSPNFILYLLPTIKEHNSKQTKSELGIVGNQLLMKSICTKCHAAGNQSMIRLYCSHTLHQQCLLKMIQQQKYACQIDGQIICPGYWNALGIKVNKNSQKLSTKLDFIKNHQQTHLLQKKNVLNTFSSATKKQQRNMSLAIGKKAFIESQKQFAIGTAKQIIGGLNRISGIKPKELKGVRAPSTVKKSNYERKQQIQSLAIGGLGMKFGSNFLGGDLQVHGLENIATNYHNQQHPSQSIGMGGHKSSLKSKIIINKYNEYAQKLS